jgi:hypothetical protein
MDCKGVVVTVPKLLRRKAAAEYLHEAHGLDRAPSTLAKLAVTGDGPVFRRLGRIPLYAPADLDAYVTSKLSPRMRSTSQAAPEKTGEENTVHQHGTDPTTRGGSTK